MTRTPPSLTDAPDVVRIVEPVEPGYRRVSRVNTAAGWVKGEVLVGSFGVVRTEHGLAPITRDAWVHLEDGAEVMSLRLTTREEDLMALMKSGPPAIVVYPNPEECPNSLFPSCFGRLRILQALDRQEVCIEPLDLRLVGIDSVDVRLGNRAWIPRECEEPVRIDELTPERFDEIHSRVSFSVRRPLILRPGDFANVITLETLRLSERVGAEIENRSMAGRLGLLNVTATRLHAGHNGPVVLELKNLSPKVPFQLQPEDPIAQVFFYHVVGADGVYGENGVPFRHARFTLHGGHPPGKGHRHPDSLGGNLLRTMPPS